MQKNNDENVLPFIMYNKCNNKRLTTLMFASIAVKMYTFNNQVMTPTTKKKF